MKIKCDKKDKSYNKLRLNNIIIGYFGIIIFIFAALAVSYLDYVQYKTKEIEKLKRANMIFSNQFQTIVGSLDLTLKLLDNWIAGNPDKDPRFDKEFVAMVDTYRKHMSNQIDIRMVTKEGKLYYFPVKDIKPLADVKDREYFLAQRNGESGKVYFSKPIISRVTGKWGIPISYKIKSKSDNIYLFLAVIEFEELDLAFKFNRINGSSILLIREDGVVLYEKPFDEKIIGESISRLVDIKPLQKNREGVVVVNMKPISENIRINAFKNIEGFPIYVIYAENYKTYFTRWIETFVSKLLLISALLTIYIVLSIRSVKLIKQLEATKKQLEEMAHYDCLTGLKNRGYFFERVEEEKERQKRNKKTSMLILMDIDDFKKLNDTYGHPAGDKILKELGEIIRNIIRSTDHAGRLGGEEFGIYLPETSLDTGIDVAERIRKALEKIEYGKWKCSVSIGVTEYKTFEETIEELYKRADDALYRAKTNGKNRVEITK